MIRLVLFAQKFAAMTLLAGLLGCANDEDAPNSPAQSECVAPAPPPNKLGCTAPDGEGTCGLKCYYSGSGNPITYTQKCYNERDECECIVNDEVVCICRPGGCGRSCCPEPW